MPDCLGHDERELRLAEHRQLARQAEYLGVRRDEAVPFRFVGVKRQQVLSAESINNTITRLGQILAVAEERDLISRNPVRVNTRNRKLKARRKRPVYLESPSRSSP
jgi:hypothetical protein